MTCLLALGAAICSNAASGGSAARVFDGLPLEASECVTGVPRAVCVESAAKSTTAPLLR